jgi:hypothetical protein
MAYKMMLCPAMKYSLSCTTLSHSECDRVDRSYLPTLLSQVGINKCTKRLLLFGIPSLGALGFTNTWTDQEIAQVQLLLGHLRQGQETGQLLQALMETLQMVIGSSLPLFHYPIHQILKFCHRNWLLNVWEFLFSIQGSAIQLVTVISLWIHLIWWRNSTVRHWYLQVMALSLWAMPLKHGSSMVHALIFKHMDMVQFQEGDSLSPLYMLKLVDMLEVCWPLMQSCQQPTMYHMHQT